MQESERKQNIWKKIPFAAIGIIAVMVVMLLLLWININNSQQSSPAFLPKVYFEGQYRIGDGEWQTVKKGKHISSTKGDVTLEGKFHLRAPSGEYLGAAGKDTPLAFYLNHILVSVQEKNCEPYEFDIESDYAGEGLCGEHCLLYTLQSDDVVTITVKNKHRFGNENSIDEMMSEFAIYADASYSNTFTEKGNIERNAGLVFTISAFVLLGIALFSNLLHIEDSSKLWLIGLCVLFAGGFFIYSAKGISFLGDSFIGNTTILGICMMMYMLCICALVTSSLSKKLFNAGVIVTALLGIGVVAICVVCMATDVRFFDALVWWVIIQSVANVAVLICLVLDSFGKQRNRIISNIIMSLLFVGFGADVVGALFGWWENGLISKCVFIALFLIAVVTVWRVVPKNINAIRKAEKMEAEQKVIRAQLQESRIAIMISQIQPHFIYNTLGTIQQLCKEDPKKASNLVRNFSLYLRGNFGELDNTLPIRFVQELEHVRYYTEIELIRFPDMTVKYDIQTKEFLLPALTVQPLVENAIKHGLMGLEEGGTVTVTSYENDTHYCVKVEDDGIGFDIDGVQDDKKHIGIRNVRERLRLMCGGSLTIESQKGKGTTALIQIPKEEMKI